MFVFATDVIQPQVKLTAHKILRIIFNLYMNISLLPDEASIQWKTFASNNSRSNPKLL